jgi:DNA-binding MarR family transcriptional regulator
VVTPVSRTISAKKAIAHKPAKRAALTISRPEMLVKGSDQKFRQLVHSLLAFLARHSAIREGHGAVIGLAGIEYTVLISIRHLAADGDVGVRDVAAHLHLSGAFTTTITNRLLTKGLIDKAPHPVDKRRLCLTVTPHGDALLDRLAPTQMQVNDAQFNCLTAKEFHQLLDMVERLVQSSNQAVALQHYLAETATKAEVADLGAKRETSRKVKRT